MIVAFLNRIGLLRPATAAGGDRHPAPHELGAAPERMPDALPATADPHRR